MNRAWLSVDLAVIRENYRVLLAALRRKNPQGDLIAVVKANAYGHGAPEVAKALCDAGARHFAVATLPEAEELRAALPSADILILGAVPPEDVARAVRGRFTVTLFSLTYARALAEKLEALGGRSLRAEIKLNTGMNRTGFPLHGADASDSAAFARSLREVLTVAAMPCFSLCGIYSHFATADDLNSILYKTQALRFRNALTALRDRGLLLPPHIGASASLLRDGGCGYAFCRVGISLLGYPAGERPLPAAIRPAAVLSAAVWQSYTVPAGESVGYGGDFVASMPTRIAVFGIGYADGLPRSAAGWQVYDGDRPLPLVGRIAMDSATCAVPAGVRAPRRVRIFGKNREELLSLASNAQTIPHELLARLGPRIDRKYIYGTESKRPIPFA